jgi:hypothetical protein
MKIENPDSLVDGHIQESRTEGWYILRVQGGHRAVPPPQSKG